MYCTVEAEAVYCTWGATEAEVEYCTTGGLPELGVYWTGGGGGGMPAAATALYWGACITC